LKYTYLWYVKMSTEALKKNIADGKYYSNWAAKAKEVCAKNKEKLLFIGNPYGTVEQIVVAVESDKPLDEFSKLTSALYQIDPIMPEYARTETIMLG
jgi:hypothetical protein